MQPPDIHHEWTAADGTRVTIRPIRPADREIEHAFVRNLSTNSRYLRFLSMVKELSPQLLDRFIQPDFPREMALIATIATGDGELEIGVARYAPGRKEGTVEFAIVIADEWQGRGLGREMLERLFDVAKQSGVDRIEGIVLASNRNMLALCRELDFRVGALAGDPTLALVSKQLDSACT